MPEDIMDKVFSFFAGDGLSDEKQNMLKRIGKDLGQNKHAKFFRVKTEETDPSFMAFLFSVYKIIYPLKVFLKDEKKAAYFRQMIIESSFDFDIRDIICRLDHAALDEKYKTISGEELIKLIQSDIDMLCNLFDSTRIKEVNRRCELFSALTHFVGYNFAGFFKRFDNHFVDGSFLIEPKFPIIKTILIINEVGEFLSVTQNLKPEDDWRSILNLIKKCEEQDLVIQDDFVNMIKTLREIHTTKILELMIQYTLRNPVWQYKLLNIKETAGENWLETNKMEAAAYILKINTIKKNNQINALNKQIFETEDLTRLENYTTHLNESFRRKNLSYYKYAEGINYLKAFLDDYVEREIKEVSDLLLIRGQWTNIVMSREMSIALHSVMVTVNAISDLDSIVSEDGPDGSRIHGAYLRVDRDQSQVRYINTIIDKNNAEAFEIINEAAQGLISYGKHLKSLIEDVQKKHPELLINWREVNLASKEPIAQRMIADYKKLNYFIQLMHLCTK